VIAHGNNRQFLLNEETAFRYFLDLLARAKTLQGYARWYGKR